MNPRTTTDRLKEQLTRGDNPWLKNIETEIQQNLKKGKALHAYAILNQEEDRSSIIHDDSFVISSTEVYEKLSITARKKSLASKLPYEARILGVKSCMPGGDVQSIYQNRNSEAIQKLSLDWLLKKEQAIITMMINPFIPWGSPQGPHKASII